jgi:hypothetical protein
MAPVSRVSLNNNNNNNALQASPKTALNFGRSVGLSVMGKSHERHPASSVSSPGPALPDPSTPSGPPPKRP